MRLTDEQIGAELYALRETPSEEFAAELDAWAAEGFPSAKQLKSTGPRKSPKFWSQRRPLLAAVSCAILVISVTAAGIAGYLGGRNNDTVTPLSSNGGESAELSAKPSTGTAAAPGPEVFLQQSRPRNDRQQVQERTAQLGLATDKIQDTADGVVDITERYDGFVDSSNVHTGGSRGRANFELRIPTQHLQDALADLSDLGRVTLLNQSGNNVTGTYVDAGKAYKDARATVDDLLEQLRNASSPSAAADIRAQLDAARQQLAAARAALSGLKQRVAYTPVSVEITAQGDGSWSIGDAADEAVGVLEAIGGAALITLAVLVPLGALLALGWLGTRELRRRRREAALD
jgi:hypothetical protein